MKNKNIKKVKPKKKLKFSKIFLGISIILFLILGIYLFSFFVDFSFIVRFFSEPQKVNLKDECSLIAGRLIHQIRDKADCELQCKNSCKMNEMFFSHSEFIFVENDCHVCDCYCK